MQTITNNSELKEMARSVIERKIDSGQEVRMDWAVMEILNQHGKPEGDSKEFWWLCAREHVYRTVKSVVERYNPGKDGEQDDLQQHLEGFQHLQKAYTVERDGDRALVPIDLISADELLARAAEFKRQSKTLRDHAEEIELYVARRSSGKSEVA
jgi:hypothetical protein